MDAERATVDPHVKVVNVPKLSGSALPAMLAEQPSELPVGLPPEVAKIQSVTLSDNPVVDAYISISILVRANAPVVVNVSARFVCPVMLPKFMFPASEVCEI